MSTAHSRKKRPETVRRALLECAATLAAERGLASITINAVAEAAGVTKGGVFHHFPSKRALIDAVFQDLMAQLDAEIEAHMARDPQPYGRFTRAYVEAAFSHQGLGANSPMAGKTISAITDPDLNRAWMDWLTKRLRHHGDTDGAPILEIVRLATDGAWVMHVLNDGETSPRSALNDLRLRLLALTQPQ